MTAITFRLSRLDTGRHAGWGLVCIEARYASIAIDGVGQLVRRFASPKVWLEIEHEVSMGLNPGPLPAASHLAQLLVADASPSIVVQWVTAVQVDAAPAEMTGALDAMLKQQAAA